MKSLIEFLKRDWPLVAILAGWFVFKSFVSFFAIKFRQKRLSQFAERHGFRFTEKDTSGIAPFFEKFLPVVPYRSYEVIAVANIIQGKIEEVEFSYFEQSLSVAYTCSAIAVNTSGSGDFEIQLNQEFNKKQIGEWIYFWPDDRKV